MFVDLAKKQGESEGRQFANILLKRFGTQIALHGLENLYGGVEVPDYDHQEEIDAYCEGFRTKFEEIMRASQKVGCN